MFKKILRKMLFNSHHQSKEILHPLTSTIEEKLKAENNLFIHNNFEYLIGSGIHALKTHNSLSYAYCEIANFLLSAGRPDLATNYYKLSLELNCNAETFSLYLQCLLLDPDCTDEQMFTEAKKYNQFFSEIIPFNGHKNALEINKKLNVGYICHFFHNSVSRSLLIPFLKNHDPDRINVFCYSDTGPEETLQEFKSIAKHWYDTKHMSHEALANLIHENQIDVLLELNGHCAINRYPVIAKKPAPIQISFYNIASTSGISAIDYIMVGDEASLDKSQSYYTENIYYLSGVTGTAIFPSSFPACAPVPSLKNDYITFGSFGASHKVNHAVIKLWCKVLKQIPTSKMLMKAGALSHQSYQFVYKNLFQAQGISSDRLIFEGHSEHQNMLECYAKIDIALDTFPHCGGTTTMEAAWQGVPVLSLCGEKYCSQNGKMILGSIGHPELVSYSEEEFIQKAIALASNKEQLIYYRNSLRDDFRHSPRADAKAFASKLEDAYIDMWKTYCEKQKIKYLL